MHNFQTGMFKNKQTPGDYMKWLANPTSPQLNFLHELTSQHLGYPATSFWGHQIVPWKFQGVPKEVLHYVREATRQPKHEFQRRMMDHTNIAKRASGWTNTAINVIKDGFEAGADYINQAARFAAKHQTTIDSAAHLANLGAALGTLTGLIKPSTADTIHHATRHIKSKPKKTNTGSGWSDYV